MIVLPEKVKYLIDTIMEAGYEAYAVGGFIRDSILGRKPNDWDITTSASPQQIKSLFKRTIDTGLQHGTVTVLLEQEGFEVTTYRVDGKYEDGRHPSSVTYTVDLKEDLKRRDFTINAIAYNDREGLVDAFGGVKDIEDKVIRCVGDPRERFQEDALRMMRAVRFSAQLGYVIEEGTLKAISGLSASLRRISAERIQAELVKLIESPHPEKLRVAYETGITRIILPEFDACMEMEQKNPHHCGSVGEHTIRSMQEIKADRILRLAMLFHDIGKPETMSVDEEGIYHFYGHSAVSEKMAYERLRNLKFDNHTVHMVTRLVRYHDYEAPAEPKHVRRALAKIGEDIFPLLLLVKQADIRAQSDYKREEKEAKLKETVQVYEQIVEQKQCVSLKMLAVTGKDLIEETGIKPGPELGQVLNDLLNLVIEDPTLNRKEFLIEAAVRKRVKEDIQ